MSKDKAIRATVGVSGIVLLAGAVLAAAPMFPDNRLANLSSPPGPTID